MPQPSLQSPRATPTKPFAARTACAAALLAALLAVMLAPLFAAPAALAAEPEPLDTALRPFFETYCLRCHDARKQEGRFRLDTLPRQFVDLAAAQRWGEVVFRMNSGEMPPPDEPRPTAEELGRAVDAITAHIRAGEAARMARRGPVAHYRLSREEYAHTVYDLLGVRFDVKLPGALNEDARWHGFERIGAALSLSPSHVERYLRAADTVVERAFPAQPSPPAKLLADAVEMRHRGERKKLEELGIADKARAVLWPGGSAPAYRGWWSGHPSFRQAGVYRARVRLSGLPGLDGRAPHLSVWHHGLKQSIFDEDILAAEGEPVIVAFETFLSMPAELDLRNELPPVFHEVGNHTLNVLNGGGSVFTHARDVGRLNPTGYKLFDDEGRAIHPTLLVDWIEWEGPITTEAERQKRADVFPTSIAPTALAPTDPGQADALWAECHDRLRRFLSRAWRRPATSPEVERYVAIVRRELDAGENFGAAYRAALAGVLTSKNFHYLEEGSATEPRAAVNDWELASRLSYFLWSSMPDEALVEVAARGELRRPSVLREQLRRMLADPKIDRFQESFPRQWLQLHRVGMFPPDRALYPDYDAWLEKSMLLETRAYFGEVFSRNLPLREFLRSDWAMVNPRLASFYGLPALPGPGFQRVDLRPEDHRGGLLTQAAILSLTSDGARHRPVHRGVWVSEAIFGRAPPPPPPNVEPLAPTPSDQPKATIRQQLEAHATHATCASCHAKIDPLGFAFDNYDAIGRWRDVEHATAGRGAHPPVNAGGALPGGRTYRDVEEFKQLLAQDIDRFAEAFVEQLATYALRRVMTVDDQAQIRAVAAASKRDDYRLRSIIENLALSDLFQKR